MSNTTYKAGLLALLALSASCSTQTADIATPATVQKPAESADATSTPNSPWTAYLNNIEAGKFKDPTGQYVSKGTRVPNGDGSAARPTRPKISLTKDKTSNKYPEPTPPIEDCPGGCPGGGGPPEPSSGFSSSENIQIGVNPVDNPNNYILNVSVIKGDYPFGLEARAGYTKIPIDLNKGAGGKTIYLCYTRYSGNVAETAPYNPEGGLYGRPTEIDKKPITNINATSESFYGSINPYRPTGWDWIQMYDGWGYPDNWHTPDLNDEAGGRYVYGIYTKGLATAGIVQPGNYGPIKEVGILYSNDDSVQPPAGWIKTYQDLNDGAGGYFIYICYKR